MTYLMVNTLNKIIIIYKLPLFTILVDKRLELSFIFKIMNLYTTSPRQLLCTYIMLNNIGNSS